MSVTAFKVRNVPPPGKKRVGDWLNMRVRTKCEMANGYATIPAGSLATVTGTGNGLWLKIDPCPHCGISVNISRVHGSDVEPIEGVSSGAAA